MQVLAVWQARSPVRSFDVHQYCGASVCIRCCLIDRLNCLSSNRLAVWPEGGAEHEGCGRGFERGGAPPLDGGGVQQERPREIVHLRWESHLALLGPHGRALLPRRVGTNKPDRREETTDMSMRSPVEYYNNRLIIWYVKKNIKPITVVKKKLRSTEKPRNLAFLCSLAKCFWEKQCFSWERKSSGDGKKKKVCFCIRSQILAFPPEIIAREKGG